MKGQVISGEFGKICVRQKSSEEIELGELMIAEAPKGNVLLQVYDLLFGSQMSQQNLELVSGIKLEEENDLEIFDPELRNYTLAFLKPLIATDGKGARLCKVLPKFFSGVREVEKEDLSFITKPKNPLFIGNLRSGSKMLDVDIYLPGEDVLSHHILVPATTGRGKSLDGDEEVLIKTDDGAFLLESINELVENNTKFGNSKVISINPKNCLIDFKKIIKFVKHNAPKFMYKVITDSGREILVTGGHNLYVMRKGNLTLLKTEEITNNDYLPLPLKIDTSGTLKELNLFELLKDSDKVYVLYSKNILIKLKPKKECLKLLSKYFANPLQKYKDFTIKKKKISIKILNELLNRKLSKEDLRSIELTDLHGSIILKAMFPLRKEFLQLIGYYVAEGYCLNDNSFRISCSDKSVQNHLNIILKKIGLPYFLIKKENKNTDMGVSSSILTKVLKKLGVGQVSGNKRLPNFFMTLSNKDLKILLKTYFEGDGGVDREIKKETKRIKISATTKSKKLASDLCMALYRFGILARCKNRMGRAINTSHKGDLYYRISISGKNDLKSFLSKVGFQFPRKNRILEGKLNYKGNTNVDLIPVNPEDFKYIRLQAKLSQRQFSLKLGCSQQIISRIELGERRPSRDLMNQILSKFKIFKSLSPLMNLRWDKIKEIRRLKYNKKYVYDLTIKDNKTFLAGHGGLFVHNSNLTSVVLWNLVDRDYCGMLVLDPHDEYYGRNGLGLKDHADRKKVVYYSTNPPTGCKSLKINLKKIRPQHFSGVVEWSDPQQQCLNSYYREYGENWIEAVIMQKPLKVQYVEGTMAVVRRRLLSILDLEWTNNQLFSKGVFDIKAGETIISEIIDELEDSKTVIIDTSSFSGATEILVGSLVATDAFARYKHYKAEGKLRNKPVISMVLEEAPRVLGKEVLEKGSNVFSQIAREGRKFKIGLYAITQLPSLIPRQILANMNTKIILGIEMAPERQAIIESASQDLSTDSRNIASLDKGEAIITSNFARFAIPVKIPLFKDIAGRVEVSKVRQDFSGIKL